MKDENKTKKQLIEELVQAGEKIEEYAHMLDAIPDVVYKMDADGHFLYVNRSVRNIGYEPEELIGKHFSTIIHPDHVASVSRKIVLEKYKGGVTGDKNSPSLFDERRTGSRVTKNLAVRVIAKNWDRQQDSRIGTDSKEMYAEVMASGQFDIKAARKEKAFLGTVGTIRDMEIPQQAHQMTSSEYAEITYVEICSSGQYDVDSRRADKVHQGTVGVIRDITERKRLEEQRERMHHAQKMESIGQLAGGIAHDFNNLLMGIQGNVALMLLKKDLPHAHCERLKNIERQAQSAAKLTSHLLGYARKGKYEVKPIDLNQLVEEVSDTFGRTRKEITIHRELADDLYGVEADSSQIEQVLLNLFVNAADAMPGGGDLMLKTMNTSYKDMKGKVYRPKVGNYVLLTVTDTGMGMDKRTMEKIFDPFFTTKEMGRGTGLGLASVYGVIKGHGGYIDADSTEGHGATFSIHLAASEKKVQKAVRTADQFAKGTGTVLLVDDEETVLEVSKGLLEAMGYQVLMAKDGKEAIEVYEKSRDDIDVVLLDMVMPKVGGGEAYDRMRQINPHVKVLLSSGFSIDGEASAILDRGCNGFIQKPFTVKELSEKIKKILEKE